MDPGTIVAILSALGAGLILRRIVDHVLNRGKVQVDQAYQIREELRAEISRKDRAIDNLDKRVDELEAELAKSEQDRTATRERLIHYQLDVYRTLVDAGVDRALLNAVLAIQER